MSSNLTAITVVFAMFLVYLAIILAMLPPIAMETNVSQGALQRIVDTKWWPGLRQKRQSCLVGAWYREVVVAVDAVVERKMASKAREAGVNVGYRVLLPCCWLFEWGDLDQ